METAASAAKTASSSTTDSAMPAGDAMDGSSSTSVLMKTDSGSSSSISAAAGAGGSGSRAITLLTGSEEAGRLRISLARLSRVTTSSAKANGSAPTGAAAFCFLRNPNPDFLTFSSPVRNCGIVIVWRCEAPSSDRSRPMSVSSSLGERNALNRMRSGTWRAIASTAFLVESTITSSAPIRLDMSCSTRPCAASGWITRMTLTR